MWIFSGVFFSSSNFPNVVQPVIKLLPLTAVNDALRANMLEGASLAGVSGQLLVVAGWLVLSFVAALKLFRWR
jgi:ABC-type polysaccharide/polyol phosphate export permease